MLASASAVKAAATEFSYDDSMDRASAKADMAETSADMKTAAGIAAYAAAEDKASAQADMLASASAVKAAATESSYDDSMEKATAKADMYSLAGRGSKDHRRRTVGFGVCCIATRFRGCNSKDAC